jgi:hypothetical protein
MNIVKQGRGFKHKVAERLVGLAIVIILIGSLVLILGCANDSPADSSPTEADIQALFDELDNSRNEGKGYSEYLNTDGFPTGALLAWSESHLMQAYANMYRATGDERYLDKLHDHIQSVLSNRDDRRGQTDYKGELVPSWGTDRYTRDNEWMHFVVHTGMITYPMLEFVQLVNESHIDRYSLAASSILEQVEESIVYHDREWRTDHYVYPEDFYRKDYIVATNQQAAMGRSLILLYELTGNEQYLSKAENLAAFIKDKAVRIDSAGEYLLLDTFIAGETTPRDDKVASTSHANLIIHFAYLAYKSNIVFDEEDMRGLCQTIKNLAEANNNHFPRYLDSTGDFDAEATAGQYIFLAEFDSGIYDSIMDLYFNHLKIDQTAKYMQEDFWGTVMLGLSRLALYQSRF